MDPSYNNPFGSFGANSGQSAPILSPVGGDVVLPKQPKKKKIGFFLGFSLIIVLATMAIALVIIKPWGNNSISKDSLHSYISLVFFGDKKADLEELGGGISDSFFKNAFDDDDFNWDEYKSSVENELNRIIDSASDKIEREEFLEQKEMFETLSFDRQIRSRTTYLANLYINNGVYGSRELLNEKMNELLSISERSDAFVYEYTERVKNLLNQVQGDVDNYAKLGCNITNYENITCGKTEITINMGSGYVEEIGGEFKDANVITVDNETEYAVQMLMNSYVDRVYAARLFAGDEGARDE